MYAQRCEIVIFLVACLRFVCLSRNKKKWNEQYTYWSRDLMYVDKMYEFVLDRRYKFYILSIFSQQNWNEQNVKCIPSARIVSYIVLIWIGLNLWTFCLVRALYPFCSYFLPSYIKSSNHTYSVMKQRK